MFVCMCKDTCKKGKGTVDHKVSIEKADLERLYGSRVLDTTTPYGLLNKVWFELCLYFCRRGRENQRELKPSMFDIRTDALGKPVRWIQNCPKTIKALSTVKFKTKM